MKTQNDQLIWQGQAYNARGQVTEYLRGTNLHTDKYYNTFGLPAGERTKAGTTDLYYTNYNFNSQKGNLTSRTDYLAGKTESFIYDNLNRLTNENVSGGTQLSTGFALNGNITQKSDIGAYTYDEAGPHAVTGLTNTTGTLLPAFDQAVDYTDFNKASFISQGEYSYYITYGPDRQRSKTVLNHTPLENTILTKYYVFGDYEKEITEEGTRHLHYIDGGDGLAAIYVKYDNAPDSLYFILKDHLGSIVGAINNETGTIYRQNFDAWGRKRNPISWTYSDIPEFPFDRGYTGHEHLKWFGLINMNGRLYDATICRFLSPDSYVQMPDYSQSYNRYSYCLNNPLVFTDPSGEKWWHWLLGDILTGGAFSMSAATTAATLAPISTEQGYEFQKYVSPIAIKLNFNFGSIQNGLGFDVSLGMLKGGTGYRYNFGATYYWSTYGAYNGWETRTGGELEIIPFLNYSGTKFSGINDQTTNILTLGDPFTNISYENDTYMPSLADNIPGIPMYDEGDRYRTAAARIRLGGLDIGLNLHTGMAGGDGFNYHKVDTDGDGVLDTWVFYGGDIDDPAQRAGVLYFGLGPLRMGSDSESIRHTFQNQFAHDYVNGGNHGSAYPWVLTLTKKPLFFWYFGTGSGNTLW